MMANSATATQQMAKGIAKLWDRGMVFKLGLSLDQANLRSYRATLGPAHILLDLVPRGRSRAQIGLDGNGFDEEG
jgi:hypothetical protein